MKELLKNWTSRERTRTQALERHVGERMRHRRILLGLNQHQLAEMIGISYQQINKYEKGINRISVGRLYTIAQALGVDIVFFFEYMDGYQHVESTSQGQLLLELASNFDSLTDRRHQAALSRLVRALADTTAHCDNSLVTKPDPDLSAS